MEEIKICLIYQIVQNVIQNTLTKMGIFCLSECAHEWTLELEAENNEDTKVIKDANGNILNDGDSVTVIKDLKVKGTSSVVKLVQK